MADELKPQHSAEKSLPEIVSEISEKASLLVREEIELAKAEVTQKVTRLARGSVVAIAAGVFLLAALMMLMHAIAWLLNDLFFGGNVWLGFLVEAGGFVLIAAGAGLFAYRSFMKGAPPVPEMAIEEARKTVESIEGDGR